MRLRDLVRGIRQTLFTAWLAGYDDAMEIVDRNGGHENGLSKLLREHRGEAFEKTRRKRRG